MKVSHLAVAKQFYQLKNAKKIIAIAIALAIGIYYQTFDFWAPGDNFITLIGRSSKFKFYSGAPGGFYIQIGEYLEEKSPEGLNIPIISKNPTFESHSTAGALENLNRVITESSAFGLVNEISAPPQYYSRSQAILVGSLYMERLHIFYNKKAFRTSVLQENPKADIDRLEPFLTENPDEYTKSFLNTARINGGPHGSGTRLLTRYFLNEIEGIESKPLLDYNNKIGLPKFKAKEYEIHFAVVGDPIAWIDQLTKDTAYAMISVGPALITKVNSIYDLNLQFANFKSKYEFPDVNRINTAGTYVNLIASQNISRSTINRLLDLLNKAEPEDFMQDSPGITKANFQLNEINFMHNIPNQLEADNIDYLTSFLLFILTVSSTTILIFLLYASFVFRSKPSQYYRLITEIHERYSMPKYQITIEKESVPSPILAKQNPFLRIKELRIGFQKIFTLIDKAYSDHMQGSITENDYEDLEKEFQLTIDAFQQEFYRQIFLGIRNHDKIGVESLHNFFSAGFLKSGDYKKLLDKLKVKNNESFNVHN